jgi:glycopeptide antibiotics resistance protein
MKAWQWWLLVVIAASGPWFGIVREPQWQRVTWIPFHGLDDKPHDMVANFLMWVPFGVAFARDRRRGERVAVTVVAGLALSVAVEALQLFYRMRDPSATDVVMAICGSAAGSLAAQAFHRSDAGRAAGGRETRDARGDEQQ